MFKIDKFVVRPLSSKKENFYLLISFGLIILIAGTFLKIRHREVYKQEIHSGEISAFSGLSNIESSIYSDLLNSLIEISMYKEMYGEIPSLELLDEEEIPPYHKDKLWEQKGAINWISFSHDNKIYMLGLSSKNNIGSFLIEINDDEIEKSNIFYTNQKIPTEDAKKNFEKYEILFKKIVPYTGKEERKKFKGE